MGPPHFAVMLEPHWADQILNHGKTIELRSKSIVKRGRIALAVGDRLVGEVRLTNCFLICQRGRRGLEDSQLPPYSFRDLSHRHKMGSDIEVLSSRSNEVWAWEIETPIPYIPRRPYFERRHGHGHLTMMMDDATGSRLRPTRVFRHSIRSDCQLDLMAWQRASQPQPALIELN